MEFLAQFIDVVLHLDKYLPPLIQEYGLWIYAILFAVIFAETGFVVLPFLPGDSLLFAVGALVAIYVATLLLTELLTNNAAAALAFPIAHATAESLGVSTLPFAIAVCVAASCGFATPTGYQTHLMVYGAGGYRFSDFMKMGLGLDIVCLVIACILIPIVIGF